MPPAIPDDPIADIAAHISALARCIQEHESHVTGLERLSPLEIMILRDIEHHPGTGPGGISVRLALRTSNTSAALRTLVDRGLVCRAPDPTDKRAVRLSLTAHAEGQITRVRGAASAFLAPHLDPARVAELREMLALAEASLERRENA